MSSAQAESFINLMNNRKEAVQLGPQVTVPLPYIQSIAANLLYNAPSSFNCQSTRMVMLVGSDHAQLWNALANNSMYSDERDAIQRNLVDAAGTFLFFEDSETVDNLQKTFPSYADSFPLWANEASGMLLTAIWSALSLEGVGACPHHYSPEVAEKIAGVPSAWKCTGQLVFGSIQQPALRVSRPVDDSHRFKVAKGDQ